MNRLEKHLSSLQDMPYIGIEYENYRKLVVRQYGLGTY